LALSSRNQYLSPAQREQATVLWQAIKRAQETVAQRPAAAARLRRETAWTIAAQPEARLDYVEFFDPETLQPVKRVKPGTQMALAVFVGRTRIIDNARL
ncbi:MAG TPA: pantoate--beta-alanine ligase, partial [Candidatus Acidoferrum sp.]|nr:pantoate--beta-alanine ligase [Candidatus Acidoferrum sp.]